MTISLAMTSLLLATTTGSAAHAPGDAFQHALAWSDFDNDGHGDVLVVHPGARATLLRNMGGGEFEERSELLDALAGTPMTGAAWADFDADGFADLVTVDVHGRVRLLGNAGSGPFLDVTEAVGLAGLEGVVLVDWTDFDGDQLSDLVAYSSSGLSLFQNVGGAFVAATLPELGSAPMVPVGGGTHTSAEGPPASVEATGAGSGGARSSTGSPTSARPLSSSAATIFPTPGQPEPGGTLAMGMPCVPGISDQSGGACLAASTAPVLGSLYPISEALFVGTDERVGLSTTTPHARLHVVDDLGPLTPADVFDDESLLVHATSAALGLYGLSGGDWSAAVTLGEFGALLGNSFLRDTWTLARESVLAGSRLHFKFGSNSDYASNATMMTLDTDGHVGIGTEDPLVPLQVVADSGTALSVVSNGPSLYALSVDPFEDDGAAFCGGRLDVGYFGAFGLPATRVELSTDGGADTGQVLVYNGSGAAVTRMEVDNNGGGVVQVRNASDFETILLDNDADGDGYLKLDRDDGLATVFLYSDYLDTGSSRIITDVIEIRGGADLVESFDTREEQVEPGTVLVIDETTPGHLRVADEPYDRKVAGIVSGAGGVRAGLHLGQDELSGDTPVALSGRVYVKASAENGPIRPGDRLTTAATPGHAMRVEDTPRADGAVIGKAMTELETGTGLVLVLVNLQ